MGWGYCGKDRYGRDIGYSVEATCDKSGCTAKIDRGLSFCCGGMHGEDDIGCAKYFCTGHLEHIVTVGNRTVWICDECYSSIDEDNYWDDDDGLQIREQTGA